MDRDDHPTGRVLTRREALALLGGAALLAGGVRPRAGFTQTLPSCVVTPEQMDGPYFTDARLNRSDIRSDPADKSLRSGVPLNLVLHVSSVGATGCVPLAGAMVDVWHCDAAGAYSDARDPGFDTVGKQFLRGYQVTDAGGTVRFTTIYPGWYEGRAVHIHFKVRAAAGAGRSHEFSSQLYFEEAVTDRVHARAPYSARGKRTQRNSEDGLFRRGGNRLMLALTETSGGYSGEFSVGLNT